MHKALMVLVATDFIDGEQCAETFRYLTPEQCAETLPYLTPEQRAKAFGYLTPEQCAFIESIPKVENLYLKIWSDIQSQNRVLKQSDFGPSEAQINICDTSMCIAGHTVHLAGEKGYELAREYGHAFAARLIHNASCPDLPLPRHDSYPYEWALAFIEEMARRQGYVG